MKTQTIIILAIAAVGAIFYFKKKKPEGGLVDELGDGIYTGDNMEITKLNIKSKEHMRLPIINALKYIKDKYGLETATVVEKIYRLETGHFGSGQFANTFSPGMEKHGSNYPFGWTSMENFWSSINFTPAFYTMPENTTGIVKTFIKFPNVQMAMESLAYYIKKYNPERWYSLDPVKQAEYRATLAKIKPRITNYLS
jgi:hypothetical protein